MHEEILEDCLRLVETKKTSEKVRGLKCIRLAKLATQF
jgi:hypothetical protein